MVLRVPPPPRVPSRDLSPRSLSIRDSAPPLLPEVRPPPAGLDPLSRLSGRSRASAMAATFIPESVRLAWFELDRV